MIRKVTNWLRNSSHVHVRQDEVATLPQLVGLLDRFLNDALLFPLEWDDFVSWENPAEEIEAYRVRIAASEPLFASTSRSDLHRGVTIVLSERNAAAVLAGIPKRDMPAWADEYAV